MTTGWRIHTSQYVLLECYNLVLISLRKCIFLMLLMLWLFILLLKIYIKLQVKNQNISTRLMSPEQALHAAWGSLRGELTLSNCMHILASCLLETPTVFGRVSQSNFPDLCFRLLSLSHPFICCQQLLPFFLLPFNDWSGECSKENTPNVWFYILVAQFWLHFS